MRPLPPSKWFSIPKYMNAKLLRRVMILKVYRGKKTSHADSKIYALTLKLSERERGVLKRLVKHEQTRLVTRRLQRNR